MSGPNEIREELHGSSKLDLLLWKRILRHALPYRSALTILALSGAVVAAIDVLFPLVTGRLVDEAIENGISTTLYGYAAAYGGLVVALTLFIFVFIVLAGRVANGMAYDLRVKGFQRLQELSFSFFDVRPVGWLVSRLTADCTKLSSLIPWFMLDFAWGGLLVLGIIGAMLWLNWLLALVVVVIVPPLAIVSLLFQRRLLRSSRMMRRTNSQLTAGYGESLMGVRTTKALAREDDGLQEFRVVSGAMYRHSTRNALQSAVYLPIVITLGSLGVGLALWRGGLLVIDDELTLGTLIAFMQYAALLSMPIQELADRFTELQAAQAAAERIQGLLDTEPEIVDSPRVVESLARVKAAGGPEPGKAIDGLPDRISSLELRGVGFSYGQRTANDVLGGRLEAELGPPVVQELDLMVEAGRTIALVGPTGGGKSTIVSLIARFYEPVVGQVLLDGIDYRERSLTWLRSKLGVVLQTPFLFSGSVRDNIRYGRLEATDEEIEDAARLVCAHDFIVGLEAGYDTSIGEGGGRLSTGQRQLVSLARAVLAQPEIFILDEATSSIDVEAERLVQAGISAVLRGRISFVIAHRLSTVREADRILFVDEGRVVEQGTHDELLAMRGRYHALYVRQLMRRGVGIEVEAG